MIQIILKQTSSISACKRITEYLITLNVFLGRPTKYLAYLNVAGLMQ